MGWTLVGSLGVIVASRAAATRHESFSYRNDPATPSQGRGPHI